MDRNFTPMVARTIYGENGRTVAGGTTRAGRISCGGNGRAVDGGATGAARIACGGNGRTVDGSIMDTELRQLIDSVQRWHGHEGIDTPANSELSNMAALVTFTTMGAKLTPDLANAVKVILEAAFQLGRRYPFTPPAWILLDDDIDSRPNS